jgi:hypothetical protein
MVNGERYALTIKNKSASFQKFAIYQTFPEDTAPDEFDLVVRPLSLAWMVGAIAPGNADYPSSAEFEWKSIYNATIGLFYYPGDAMMTKNSVQMPLDAENENSLVVTYYGDFPIGAPAFSNLSNEGEKGVLQIESDWKIPTAEQQHTENCFLKVGLAMAGKAVAVADLHPDVSYQFTLEPRYHIVAGDFYPSQVIGEAEKHAFWIEFPEDIRHRVLIFDENGKFEYETD